MLLVIRRPTTLVERARPKLMKIPLTNVQATKFQALQNLQGHPMVHWCLAALLLCCPAVMCKGSVRGRGLGSSVPLSPVNFLIFIHFHTFSYIFIHFHIFSFIFIHFHTFSYMFIHFHTFSYIYIHFHTFSYISYIFIHFHTFSYMFIHFHICSYILIYFHTFSYMF